MPYSTDTRTLQPGDVYVAIRGERHDGHAFIPQAIEKGAAGVVTEVSVDAPPAVEVIRVDSALGYLVGQAVEKVRRLQPDIVAITGSVGKTTTRAAVRAVLAERFDVVASEGNKNTPLGLSLLVLNRALTPETKLVLEMGARLPGDIRELTGYFPPTISVVTNVRGVHVETLGSVEGVAREKGEIVRGLRPGGTACLNGDDPLAAAMAGLHPGRTLLYGRGAHCDVRPDALTAELPILGDHAVYTALAALSVGRAFGMADEASNRGLAKIRTEPGRLARLRGRNGSTLIDDSYNASPEATLAALRVLASHPAGRRVAFLGDMLELGPTEVVEHARVLQEAAHLADEVHTVGPIMARAVATLPESDRSRITSTVGGGSSALANALAEGRVFKPGPGDVALVKGSQGMRMERVSAALLHPDVPAAEVLPRQSESWKHA